MKIIIISFIILLGCTPNKINKNKESIQIYTKSEEVILLKNPVLLKNFYDTVKCITLETNKNSLIGTIGKVIYFDEKFFILDLKGEKIMVFNEHGKYLNKIGCKGRGATEYLCLYDFEITKDSTVNIVDFGKRSILKYSFKGEYLSRIKLENRFSAYLISDSKNRYHFHHQYDIPGENNITIIDKNGKRLSSYYKIEDYFSDIGVPTIFKPFSKNNEDVFFVNYLDNSVYMNRNDSLFKKYTFDFGGGVYNAKMLREVSRKGIDIYNFSNKNDLPMGMDYLNVTDDYLSITITKSYKRSGYFYNRKNKSVCVPDYNIGNTWNIPIPVLTIGVKGDMFIGAKDASFFRSYYEQIKQKLGEEKSQIYKEMTKIYNNTKDDDNPILILFKPKI